MNLTLTTLSHYDPTRQGGDFVGLPKTYHVIVGRPETLSLSPPIPREHHTVMGVTIVDSKDIINDISDDTKDPIKDITDQSVDISYTFVKTNEK